MVAAPAPTADHEQVSGETLTGVQRATALLSAIGAEAGARPGGVGVVELARALGGEKTPVSPTRKAVQAAGWVGRTTPVHCTASGRALLFDHTEEQVRALFAAADLKMGGGRAPRNAADLWARVGAARARSYALTDEEFEAQLVAAAPPVRDFRGHVIAAVNVSGPKFRLGEVLEPTGTRVKAAADVLSHAIGYGPSP